MSKRHVFLAASVCVAYTAYAMSENVASAAALNAIGSPDLELVRGDEHEWEVVPISPRPNPDPQSGMAAPAGGEGVMWGQKIWYELPYGERVSCVVRWDQWEACSGGWRVRPAQPEYAAPQA
ncbi:MAG: hypothetical protein AAFX03_01040 [Pseudomonadota bacterium]